MLLRVSLVSGSVVGLNIWQANKVHAAIPDTFEQPAKKKIRPSEVNEPIYHFSCFYFKQCWQFICHLLVKDWICSWLLYSGTTTTTTVLRPFVRDYPGEPVQEETLTYPPPWSLSNLYQLLPSTAIHSILLVQITCLAILLHNLFPCPLWSTSWSGALHLIFHTFLYFLHPMSVFFLQHMPIASQPVLV